MLIVTELNVLVIDDNDHGRSQTKQVLNRLGITNVQTVSDAVNGFEILNDGKIDVVFLDWYMPEINGAGLVRLVRSGISKCRKDIPIIITTAYSTRENTTRIRELELKEVLSKPFTSKQLGSALSIAYARAEPKLDLDGVDEEPDQYLV